MVDVEHNTPSYRQALIHKGAGTAARARITSQTVAVFGAGPVGLLSAYCSVLKGASEVFVVDNIPEQLAKAKELRAIPIDFSESDPVEQILAARKKNDGIQQA